MFVQLIRRPIAVAKSILYVVAGALCALAVMATLLAATARATAEVNPNVSIDATNPLPTATIGGQPWFTVDSVQFAVTINDNGEPGVISSCNFDYLGDEPCILVETTPNHYLLTYSALLDGPHSLTITAMDSEGDVNNATIDFGVDVSDPMVTVTRPLGASVKTTHSSLSVEFDAFDGFSGNLPTMDCRVDSGAWDPCEAVYLMAIAGRYKHNIVGLAPGAHLFEIRATDEIGHATLVSLPITVQATGQGVDVSMSTSSNFSSSNADLRIEVANNTDQDLTNLSYSLPQGFLGSLDAVPGSSGNGTRCPYAETADAFTTCDESIRDGSRIGVVNAVTEVGGSDVVLTGTVHLTDPYAAGEPAGLAFAMHATLGELDFGWIVIPARVLIKPTEYDPLVYEDQIRSPEYLETIVDYIPTAFSDPDHGDIDFTIKSLVMDIFGDPPGGNKPLLYVQSDCEPRVASAEVGTSDGDSHIAMPEHTAEGCDEVPFAPAISELSVSNNVKGNPTGVKVTVGVPAGHSTIRNVELDMPRSLEVNFPALGTLCQPSETMVLDPEDELNGGCPAETVVGTATVVTPLLITPISGEVYIEYSGGTLPYLYINLRDSTLGVNSRMRVSSYVVSGGQNGNVRSSLDADSAGGERPLPSVPITSFTLDLPGTHQGPSGELTPLFKVAQFCHPTDAAIGRFTAYARPGGPTHQTASAPVAFANCVEGMVISGGPAQSSTTSSTTAAFNLNWTGAGTVTFRCSLDGAFYDTNCGIGSGVTSGTKTYTGLSDGVHQFVVYANGGSDADVRIWKVDTTAAADGTPPSTPVITGGPADASTTPDTTPTWSFASTDAATPAGSLKFQCRLDLGSYQPCGTGSPGSFTAPAPLAGAAALFDGSHNFSVRAEDASGNLSAASASVTFTVARPFAPGLSAVPTTVQARGNPAIALNISNDSAADPSAITLALPEGMLVNTASVAAVCGGGQATAGSCPPASKIADLTAVAQVDRSSLSFDGSLHIVEPAAPGGAMRVVAQIDLVTGGFDMQSKLVLFGTVATRGGMQGVDLQFDPLPTTVFDTFKSTDMTFRLRSLKLDFAATPSGGSPLFTNPSRCLPGAFGASVGAHAGGSASATAAFQPTGCAALGFGPTLSASMAGRGGAALKPGALVAFHAQLAASPANEALRDFALALPAILKVNSMNLPPALCEAAQAAARTCPAAARVGGATIATPLMPAPVTGDVYLLRNVRGGSTPDLVIQFAGLPVDLAGTSSTGADGRLTYSFGSLPDIPVGSIDIAADGLLSLTSDSCGQTGLSVSGTATGVNASSVPLNAQLQAEGMGITAGCGAGYGVVSKFKNKSRRSTMKIVVNAGAAPKIKKIAIKLPSGMKMVKKALARKLVVKADGRKLKPKCFKFRKATLLDVGLCGKPASKIELSFGAGALTAAKKVTGKSKATLSVTADGGTTQKLVTALSTR